MREELTVHKVIYRHRECLFDFAGNHRENGLWADYWESDDGRPAVTFGGDWISRMAEFKEMDRVLTRMTSDIDRLVNLSASLWLCYKYPSVFTGEDAVIAKRLLENEDFFGDALRWLETKTTKRNPDVVTEGNN